ncbi:hypothetical protein [Euzebya tangerina]|uniref:hypothetical protein n=1 Tax=Euzebya tangerina TaxID=591198 RepID=UPI000E3165E8|nr:hypothetical protein [Euzebya tangerina]
MPDLQQMLTNAAPPVEPPFTERDIREAAARRRRLRQAIVAVVAVVMVLSIGSVAGPFVTDDEPVVLSDGSPTTELTSLEDWPTSIDFAGVEVEVVVHDGPTEPLQHRVVVGEGEAALNVLPSDYRSDGNEAYQAVRNRLWFGCGPDTQVVRIAEVGRAAGAPAFEAGRPGSARFLPAGALVEAARQLAERMDCTPHAPPETPTTPTLAADWIGPLAAAIDEAGLATCCTTVFGHDDPETFGSITDWGIFVDADTRLSISVTSSPSDGGPGAVAAVQLAGGRVAEHVPPPNQTGTSATFTCAAADVTAWPADGDLATITEFLTAIGCLPEIPAGLLANAELGALLTRIGIDDIPDGVGYQPVADLTVAIDGRQFQVRAGGTSQVGLAPGAQGVEFECGIGYSIEILGVGTMDTAAELAELIRDDPGCALPGVF